MTPVAIAGKITDSRPKLSQRNSESQLKTFPDESLSDEPSRCSHPGKAFLQDWRSM